VPRIPRHSSDTRSDQVFVSALSNAGATPPPGGGARHPGMEMWLCLSTECHRRRCRRAEHRGGSASSL